MNPGVSQIILSHFQAEILLAARKDGQAAIQVSPDLGLSSQAILLEPQGACFPGEAILPWHELEDLASNTNSCFVLETGRLRKIQFYSELTGRTYSLYPTAGAPTMLVSGIPMHRIKDTDPWRDTLEKVKSIKPVVGRVLDTATGLGYTAIEAAKTAVEVVTIELDPAALQVARLNPWSRALFDNPKIVQKEGDSFEVVKELPDASFSRILHDPPVFSLAGDLYSGEFYRQLYRLLRSGGKLFHYIGDPESKSGRNLTASVMRRLEAAGFRGMMRAPRAFGVTAFK